MKVVLDRRYYGQLKFSDACRKKSIHLDTAGSLLAELGVIGFRHVWYNYKLKLFWIQPTLWTWRNVKDPKGVLNDKRECERLVFNNLGWELTEELELLGICRFHEFKSPGFTYDLKGHTKSWV